MTTHTMTLTITNIPDSLADLIEATMHVDAPLDPEAVARAARAWVIVSTMATHLGAMDGDEAKISVASLIAMFAAQTPTSPPSPETTSG